MPNRILRDGILTSPKVAKLGWPEEVLYRRLMSLVDDFGRYFASPDVLRGHAFPRQLNKVSDSDVGKWLVNIEAAGLVRVYPAQDGERYLELLNFGQQVRATKSKFPKPPDIDNTCNQLLANDCLDVSVSVSVSEDDKPASQVVQFFGGFWEKYPKKTAKPDALKAFKAAKLSSGELERILADIESRRASEAWTKDGGKYIPNPATYLRQRRWEDQTDDIPSGRVDPALAGAI